MQQSSVLNTTGDLQSAAEFDRRVDQCAGIRIQGGHKILSGRLRARIIIEDDLDPVARDRDLWRRADRPSILSVQLDGNQISIRTGGVCSNLNAKISAGSQIGHDRGRTGPVENSRLTRRSRNVRRGEALEQFAGQQLAGNRIGREITEQRSGRRRTRRIGIQRQCDLIGAARPESRDPVGTLVSVRDGHDCSCRRGASRQVVCGLGERGNVAIGQCSCEFDRHRTGQRTGRDQDVAGESRDSRLECTSH